MTTRLEDELPRFRVHDLLPKLRAHPALEHEAVLILSTLAMHRCGQRPRRHRVLRHLVQIPGELWCVRAGHLHHAYLHLAALVQQLGYDRFGESLNRVLRATVGGL